MAQPIPELETLKDIKQMMERSSRFISLSGWSGIAAGITALVALFMAHHRIMDTEGTDDHMRLKNDLLVIAVITFIVAFALAGFFTLVKSRKERTAVFEPAVRRLLWNTLLPILVGGIFIWRMISMDQYTFIVPATLIFYGLGFVNGSKYTRGEVRWLGYGEILLGLISVLFLHHEFIFLALGFGMLHIVYGVSMWWKYDRTGAITDLDNEANAH